MSEAVTIIGYSIDSVIEAVCQQVNGNTVTLMATAELGSPLDTYHDMISEKYSDMLNSLLGGIEYVQYANPRFIYIPYDRVELTNKRNGVFQLPFNKKSFAEDEWKAINDGFNSKSVQECYANKSNSPSKLLTTIKGSMPESFNNTFGKALSMTRWRGVQLSHLTMLGYLYEYSFEHLAETYSEVYYRPTISFNELCNRLIDKFGITLVHADKSMVKNALTNRNYGQKVVMMDNRVDQYLKYMGGRFDRSRLTVTEVKPPVQLSANGNGLYFTPLNEFWAVMIDEDRAFKLNSVQINTLNNPEVSEIPLTRNNVKTYDQYSSILKLYGNKCLDLGQRIETLVK